MTSRFDRSASSTQIATALQQNEAAERVEATAEERVAAVELLQQPGGIALADGPEFIAARIDRLSRYYPDIRPIEPLALAEGRPAAMEAAGKLLERVINTEDFLGVRYMEGGTLASRAVGRVNIRDERGKVVGYGTGSLVAPRLLLTNHHVLPDKATAGYSGIEFDYQDGLDGRPLPSKLFDFAPDELYIADAGLDFALVAVSATAAELAPFAFIRLIRSEGKAIVGDFVSIIQHPSGEKKQVALRENRIVQRLDNFLHYETDTEPGSSGSPVFNDEWEMIALHHASVPAPEKPDLGGLVNEGVRVSRILGFLANQQVDGAGRALLDEFLAGGTTEQATAQPSQVAAVPPLPAPSPQAAAAKVTMTVPLEITVGTADGVPPASASAPFEAVEIDPDYSKRQGYDPDFLGGGEHSVPLPTLPADLAALAATNAMAEHEPRHVLPYHHFSVVLNAERRLAFFTAVNIDGTTSQRLKRERDKWTFDPRLPAEQQTGEEVYANNPLDRGHLVRRLDPAWGNSTAAAKLANDDTFHFTNCTPQHEDFNQNQTTWAGLEDYILENADDRDFRVNVFTGPVLAADDEPFEGVQLPRQFWKVVTMVTEAGRLSATAYLLSQEKLIRGLELAPEAFSYGEYRTYQVPVRRVEDLTKLSFGRLREFDPLERLEAAAAVPQELIRLEQIRL